MRLDTFMLADHAAVVDNKLYINGGSVTRLNVPVLPFALPLLAIVVRFLIESDDDLGRHSIGLSMTTPGGIELLPDDPVAYAEIVRIAAPIEGEEHAVQMALNFGAIPILEAGAHTLTLTLDGESVRTMKLPVVLIDPPGEPTAPNRAERRRQARVGKV